MTKTKDKRDTIKQHDFRGLRDRLAKIDHADILTKGAIQLCEAEKFDAEAVLTLSTAVSVTGISRDDFEALIELGAIEIHSYEFNQPHIPIKDLCAVVGDSARYKASRQN
jgi:hypothetical protein